MQISQCAFRSYQMRPLLLASASMYPTTQSWQSGGALERRAPPDCQRGASLQMQVFFLFSYECFRDECDNRVRPESLFIDGVEMPVEADEWMTCHNSSYCVKPRTDCCRDEFTCMFF